VGGAQRPGRRSDCPTAYALDVFGDRWTLLVIRDLMFGGKRRYGDFLDSEEGIATNILSDRLARLEACGILAVSPDPNDRRRKVYRLTHKGLDLAPLMVEMILWSAKHDPRTAASKAFVRRARRDREGLLRAIAADVEAVDQADRA
jgi:DNA-binding HxlR family transcriptional regulator